MSRIKAVYSRNAEFKRVPERIKQDDQDAALKLVEGWMVGRMDGCMDGQMDGYMDGQMDDGLTLHTYNAFQEFKVVLTWFQTLVWQELENTDALVSQLSPKS